MATNLILFVNAMWEVIDLPHLYRHLGISLAMWVLIFAEVILDLVDGVHTARALHHRVHSHKLRATVVKFGEYWRFLLFGFFFDLVGVFFPWYSYPYMTIVITLGLSVIELKSMLEHAKKRKSKTADLPKTVQDIVECATSEDALKLIKTIKELTDEKKE